MSAAHADQLNAATADSERRLRWISQHAGSWTASPQPGPIVRAIVDRFHASLTNAHHCGHLAGPQPCIGYVWRPGLLMCGACAIATAESIIGTPDDYVCDACTRRSEALTTGASVLGPIVVTFGLCAACVRANTAPRH